MANDLPQPLQAEVDEVAADRERGASELARHSLEILATAAHTAPADSAATLHTLLNALATALMAARPSMAPIYNLLHCWCKELEKPAAISLDELRTEAAAHAAQLIQASREAVERIAVRGAQLIQPGETVITHSFSSTVVAVLEKLQNQSIQVIVTESRPRCEGYQLAQQLSQWAIPTTLITDAQVGLFVQHADVALVGADTLLADGALVNKVGTYPLALAAHAQGIPFYVCCEQFKRRTEAMSPLELEAMDPAELGAPAYPHVTVKNIYFEITPARLITEWISE